MIALRLVARNCEFKDLEDELLRDRTGPAEGYRNWLG